MTSLTLSFITIIIMTIIIITTINHHRHYHQATNMGLTVGSHPVRATLTILAGAS
jgi:hypothetical protein